MKLGLNKIYKLTIAAFFMSYQFEVGERVEIKGYSGEERLGRVVSRREKCANYFLLRFKTERYYTVSTSQLYRDTNENVVRDQGRMNFKESELEKEFLSVGF